MPLLCGPECSPLHFRQSIQPRRRPAVLRGLDLGPCLQRWKNPEYLCSRVGKDHVARVHVTTQTNMDFRGKNFKYREMLLRDVLKMANLDADDGGGAERYYLRDVGQDPRGRQVARLDRDFPELAEDFKLDGFFDHDRLFSSVLRISSAGLRLWTHYDVMDNLYAQVRGRKKAVLWAPDQALNLYLDGDKSRVLDVDGADEKEFPLFLQAPRQEFELQPGDVLFIPAMWFHNMTALDSGVAVNVFWRNLDESVYDKKDVYGNRDLLPAAKAIRMMDNVLRQLDGLPQELKDFYGRRLIDKIDKKCLI